MTWPTKEETNRSPSPNRFLPRQLSRIDYEEEDPEAEALVGDVPLIRVPLHHTDSPNFVQEPSDQEEHNVQVPEKHEEEENPMELEEVVGKQVQLTHLDAQDWKGEQIVEDATAEKEPFAPKQHGSTQAGVSFVLGGSLYPKKDSGTQEKLAQDSLHGEEAQMYDIDDAVERF